MRCKPDLPVDKRFAYSVLFGLKYLLCTEWDSHRGGQVNVDMNKNIVKVKGETALTISFQNEEPHLHYEQGWNEWLQSRLWDDLVHSAGDRYKKAIDTALERAATAGGKGKGKEDPMSVQDPWGQAAKGKGKGKSE